jgi:hypothetical protein
LNYPKCLKVNQVSTNTSTLELGDDKLPSNPTPQEIERIKEKLFEE